MPGLQRRAQRQPQALRGHLADEREAELEVRREPGGIEGKAGGAQLGDHVIEVLLHEGGQQKAVVQGRAPPGEPLARAAAVGLAPEARHQGAQQQLLRQAHARVRRHLEGAQLQQAQAPRRAVRREELVDAELGAVGVAGDVDEQVAQGAVHQPGRHVARFRCGRRTRYTCRLSGGAPHPGVPLQLRQRDLQFVDLIVARLVDAWGLAGGADEQAAEQVAQRGVVVPVGQQAGQQVRPAQEGAVGRRRPAQHEVVAPARAGMAPVEHELFGGQARLVRRLVQELGAVHQFAPGGRGVDVDLDDAGIGRHLQQLQPRVARRRVALQHQLHALLGGRGLHRPQQGQVVLQVLQRRHEDVQHPAVPPMVALGPRPVGALRVAHLHAQRGTRDAGSRLATLRPRGLHHARDLVAQGCGGAQGRARRLGRERVGLPHKGPVFGRGPGQRIQRQPQAHGRIARDQVHPLVTQEPAARDPARLRLAGHPLPLQRQHVAGGGVQPLGEHAAQTGTFQLVIEFGVERVDVHGQLAFAPEVIPGVLIAGQHQLVLQPQAARERRDEGLGVSGGVAVCQAFVGEQRGVGPAGLAVGAPADGQRPARQLFARVPLALAEMQETARPVARQQAVRQFVGQAALGGAQGVGVPFRAVTVVHRDEGGLAAHGQAHVAGLELGVHGLAQALDVGPLRLGVGLGHTRGLEDALDLHPV